MKILLDENVDNRLQNFLESQGYKTQTTYEVGLASAEDTELLKYCLKNKFIILTHDDDFLSLINEKEEAPSIIYLSQRTRLREMKRRLDNLKDNISKTNEEIYP